MFSFYPNNSEKLFVKSFFNKNIYYVISIMVQFLMHMSQIQIIHIDSHNSLQANFGQFYP